MISLDTSTLATLKASKNLLAFSAGVDSSALFFLLLENKIDFDIALVNYGLREASQKEELHAIALGEAYHLKVYTIKAPIFSSNFEKNAREFRYVFFDELIEEHHYHNLLTAHQLNDQLEWFFMRLTKGAGTSELLGLDTISKRKDYTLIRPLLHLTKEEILSYLHQHHHPYFIDKSNQSDAYERNRFRKNFSDKLLLEYREGIKRTFNYLKEDKKLLNSGYQEIFHHKKLFIIKFTKESIIIRVVDKYLKKLGYLLSSAQRGELKSEKSIVFGGVWAVEIKENKIYISPYRTTPMAKKFKEQCRVAKLPPKIRAYLYEENLSPITLLSSSLSQ